MLRNFVRPRTLAFGLLSYGSIVEKQKAAWFEDFAKKNNFKFWATLWLEPCENQINVGVFCWQLDDFQCMKKIPSDELRQKTERRLVK